MALTAPTLPYKLQLEEGERLGYLDDPGPLPDAMLQNPSIFYLVPILIAHFGDRDDVFVDSDTFVYYNPDNKRRRIAPDCYVAVGVDAKAIFERNGYMIWEAGKPPDFAMEVASPSTAPYDITAKRALYAYIGMSEYWRYDPTGGDLYGDPLVGERLVDGEYRPIPTRVDENGWVWGYSAALDLHLCHDVDRLRVLDPDTGEFMADLMEEQSAHAETKAALNAAETARDAERAARQDERMARQAAEARLHEERVARQEERAARELSDARLNDEMEARGKLEAELRELRERLRNQPNGEEEEN